MEEPSLQMPRPLAKHLRWLIGIRLVVVTSIALPTFLYQVGTLDEGPAPSSLYMLAGVTYAASLLYLVLLGSARRHLELQAYIQLLGDLILVTNLVWYSGGVSSPLSIFYLVVVALGSTLLDRRAGLRMAIIAWLMYAGTVLAPAVGWADAIDPLPAGPTAAWHIVYSLAIHLFGFVAVALLTSRLVEKALRVQRDLAARQDDLAALQSLHRDVVESVPSGLITTDRNDLILTVNRAALEILGLGQMQLTGTSIHDLGILPRERWDQVTRSSRLRELIREEVEWKHGGTTRWLGFSVTGLRMADDEAAGHILIFQDLTPYRKLQEEVRMKDRMAAVGELAAGIAHEVGNPLAAISGSVQMLTQREEVDSPRTKLLRIIFKESQRLDRTIKGFLQYAQPTEQRNMRFDAAALLTDELDLLRNSSEVTDRHELEIDLVPRQISIVGDPDQISQIFWNLSQNALRAMRQGGRLRVEARLLDGLIRLRFIDTGRGMNDHEKANLFHPYRSFFDGGTGIGMAIVYRIVQDRDGRISVDSRPGGGTTITVELPLSADATESAQQGVE